MKPLSAAAFAVMFLLAVAAAQEPKPAPSGCSCGCDHGQSAAGPHAGHHRHGQAACPHCGQPGQPAPAGQAQSHQHERAACPHCGGHGQAAAGAKAGPQAGGGMGGDHAADMALFHYLGDHGNEIRRTIKVIPKGVDTLTESDNPEVAEKIRQHVVSMSARVEEQRPIHVRDPLFAEVFKHARQISMTHEATEKGVRVVETSDDPYVAKLIQAHAEVVSLFIKNGRAEMMKNHEVPAR